MACILKLDSYQTTRLTWRITAISLRDSADFSVQVYVTSNVFDSAGWGMGMGGVWWVVVVGLDC